MLHTLTDEKRKARRAAAARAWYHANKDRARVARRAHREANREAVRAQKRADYQRDREAVLAQQKAYRLANAEKIRARKLAYTAANRANEARRARQWHAANPDRARLTKWQVGVRRKGVPADEVAVAYVALLFAEPCRYCGGEGGSIDHVTPVVAGGTSAWWNLAPACRSCNSSKRDSDLDVWLAARVAGRAS